MTIKIGDKYVHTVLGYVDDSGATVITEDAELATMTGRYEDRSAAESADPAAYEWTAMDTEESDADDLEEEAEKADGASELLYRVADTQKEESVQGNLVSGTNQGADGWESSGGALSAVECQPDSSADPVSGVRWEAAAGGTLTRTAPIPGDAVPGVVTVSFWWTASAACGLTASIGANGSGKQTNRDSADLDADGNALDLTGAWVFFQELVQIGEAADSYVAKITTDSAATIDLCNFKVEAGDKVTEWTPSVEEAMATAQEARGTIDGLTLIKEGKVYIDGGKLYVDQAFVNSLFAQDITATGTISGLKLRGEGIDISSEYTQNIYDTNDKTTVLGQEVGASVLKTGFSVDGAAGHHYLDYWTLLRNAYITYQGVNYTTEIMMSTGVVSITGRGLTFQSETPIVVRAPCETDTYTEFDGGVVTEGNVTVAVKMGWCLVHGRIKLDGTVSDLITVLDGAKVPAPQTGISIGTTAGYWTSSYTRLMRVVVGAGGGLRIMYGAAGLYDFAISYPVGESYTGDTSTTGRAGSAIVGTATAA